MQLQKKWFGLTISFAHFLMLIIPNGIANNYGVTHNVATRSSIFLLTSFLISRFISDKV